MPGVLLGLTLLLTTQLTIKHMHIWPSLQVQKTQKLWHPVPPKGLTGKDLQEFYTEARLNKHIKLGIITKEKRVDKKDKRD